jgi:hypothetical protein
MEALQRAKLDGFDGLSLWELSLSAVVVWTGTPPIKSSGVPPGSSSEVRERGRRSAFRRP